MKNLTEYGISKMKVTMATQIFSRTVATSMRYLADKKILTVEYKDTADVLLFFDELFDSMNGSHDNSKTGSRKLLLRAVTPNSEHSKVWARAKRILKSSLNKEGKVVCHRVLTGYVRWKVLKFIDIKFKEHKVKSFWMRHLNQDPLEIFFGCIRSHGYRNVSPTSSGFEAAFASRGGVNFPTC